MAIIHRETIISEIDIRIICRQHPYHGFGDENLFNFIKLEYIHENMLGSRLISIYKKLNNNIVIIFSKLKKSKKFFFNI